MSLYTVLVIAHIFQVDWSIMSHNIMYAWQVVHALMHAQLQPAMHTGRACINACTTCHEYMTLCAVISSLMLHTPIH